MISQYDQQSFAQYKPISMQEMWAPAAEMRQQHDKLQEEYAQQEQQGGLSLLGIDPVKDKAAYDIQQNFITKTKEAADQLATKGFIDSGRRRGLMEVKSLYTNQVVPLQNQLKIRQERAEELRKMQLQDPTFRATANPNDVDLMTGLKNPNAYDYDGVSGNQLYSTAAKKLEQLSKTINQDVPELKKMPKLSFQYFTAIQSGATPDQAANAMKREGYDPTVVDKMTNMIHGTIDSTMKEFGVYDKFKGNDKAINELWDSTSQAAYNAIGTRQFGQVHDSWSETKATKALNTPPPEALSNGYLQDIQSDPEIIQSQRFNDNLNLVNHIDNKKYKKSSTTIGFDYDAEVAKIKNDKTMSSSDRNNALAGLARANNFSNVGNDKKYNEKIESLARKYKTTNLSEIKNRILAENEFLKVAYSQHGITGKDNYPLKNILSSISSYGVDISDLTDDKGNVNETTTKIYQHPTKGLVIQGVDKKGKVTVKKLPADIIGNPTLVKYIGANTLPVLTDQILNGNVDVDKMISSGELKVDPQNKNHYIFTKPIVTNSGEYYNNNSYTKEDLNDGIYQPELMKYINDRQQSVFNQYETRLQGQNKGYDVGPK